MPELIYDGAEVPHGGSAYYVGLKPGYCRNCLKPPEAHAAVTWKCLYPPTRRPAKAAA